MSPDHLYAQRDSFPAQTQRHLGHWETQDIEYQCVDRVEAFVHGLIVIISIVRVCW